VYCDVLSLCGVLEGLDDASLPLQLRYRVRALSGNGVASLLRLREKPKTTRILHVSPRKKQPPSIPEELENNAAPPSPATSAKDTHFLRLAAPSTENTSMDAEKTTYSSRANPCVGSALAHYTIGLLGRGHGEDILRST
jgi:hypothetical protein